jgi:histone H3/H4|tara:strand:+ start:389 stop:526 length:138 start_codon:yes stop_codon:yes gene_type:complete
VESVEEKAVELKISVKAVEKAVEKIEKAKRKTIKEDEVSKKEFVL